MTFGQGGMRLLKAGESLRLTTYDDATGKPVEPGDDHAGVLTIGYGHTGADVVPGMVITPDRAEELLASDLGPRVAAVNRLVAGCGLNQNQFDALVCFAFNVGAGREETPGHPASGLAGSTLLKMVRAGDFKGAAGQFALWNKSGGHVLSGLIKRRADEASLFTEAAS